MAPNPIDQQKAREALLKFREALIKSADSSIETKEGAEEAVQSIKQAAFSLTYFKDVWADPTRLNQFAEAANVSIEDLKSTLSSLEQSSIDLSKVFDNSFPKMRNASLVLQKAAVSFADAFEGNPFGTTKLELDKIIERMRRYSNLAEELASAPAKLGGVGDAEGGSLSLQKEMFEMGLLDPQAAKDLNTHLLKSMGHVAAQRDSLMGMWEETKRQLPLLTAAKAAVEQQLGQVGERKVALDKEQAAMQETMRYQQFAARSDKEKELRVKERALAESEQSINERASLIEREKGVVAVDKSLARQLSGEERRIAQEQILARERDIAAREAVLNSDKENLISRRNEISVERSRLEEGIRLANDRTALEIERASISERRTLAEQESARIQKEKNLLQISVQEFESRKTLLSSEQRATEQAILDARKEKLKSDEIANEAEKNAIAEKEKNTAFALSVYQDKAALDQEISFFNQTKTYLADELQTLNNRQQALDAEKASFAQRSAGLSEEERTQEQASLADKQVALDREKAQNLDNTRALEKERKLADEANALYTDRTALDLEIAALTNRETAATAEEASLATETTKLADDRRIVGEQTNLSAEERARKESEFSRRETELANRQSALLAEKALIQEEKIATTALDAIVRANEREAIRKSNQAAADKEMAARREALNSEEQRIQDEKERLDNSYIETTKRQYELIAQLKSIDGSTQDLVDAIMMDSRKWISDFEKTIKNLDSNVNYQKSILGLSEKWAILEGNNVQYWRDQLREQGEVIKQRKNELREEISAYEALKNSAESIDEAAMRAKEAAIQQKAAAIAQMEAALESSKTSSPITIAFKDAIKPLITEVKRTAEYQDARFNLIGTVSEMGWFAARTEMKRLKEEEKFFRERKKTAFSEMKRLEEAHAAGIINREEFETSFAEAAKDLKEFADAEKGTKSRRKEVEERESKGLLGNQLESLEKTMSKLTDGFKKAASHWITKLLGLLILLGFLIRRGILSPQRIARVVALIVDFVVKGLIALFKLVVAGLLAVVQSIFIMFAEGNILAGIISSLIFIMVSLLVLANLINLASIGWAKIAGAATTISQAFLSFNDGLKKLSGLNLSGFFKDLGSRITDGFKNMFGMVSNKVGGIAEKAATVGVQSAKTGVTSAATTVAGAPANIASAATVAGSSAKTAAAPAGAAATLKTPPGAGRFNGFLKGIADGLKQLGSTKTVKGAATLALLATAVMMIAAAFVLFSKVSWNGVLIGLTTIFALVQLTKMLSKAVKPILIGASAMKYLAISMIFFAGSLLVLALAMQAFNKVEWGSLIKAGLAIVMFGFLMVKMVPFIPFILAGAATIALMGLALIPMAVALRLAKGLEIGGALVLAAATYLFGIIASNIAKMTRIVSVSEIIKASLMIGLIGLSVIPMSIALQLARGIQLGSAMILVMATFLFGSIAYGLSLLAKNVSTDDITKGGMIIGMIGLALLPISVALLMARGINLKGAALLSAAVFIFGGIAYAITKLSKVISMQDVIKGGMIMGMIGVALLPISIALLMARGISVKAAMLLAAAVYAFGYIAYNITKLTEKVEISDIIKGSALIGLIGVALIPLAAALHLAKGISFGAIMLLLFATITFGSIGLAISHLSKTIPIAGILKGALIIALIGFAVMPMAWALKMVKGVSLKEAFILLSSVILFTLVALAIGLMGPLLAAVGLGALVILGIGLAIQPMAHALSMMKGISWDQLGILLSAVAGFSAIAVLIGALTKRVSYKAILGGALVMGLVGLAVMPMAYALSLVSGVSFGAIGILATAIASFTAIALVLGAPWFIVLRPMIKKGAIIIGLIGLAVLPMAYALSLTRGLDIGSIGILIGATLGFAAIAAALGFIAMSGVGALALLAGIAMIVLIGFAIRPMMESLSLAKGLDTESISTLVEATLGFAAIAAGLGLLILATGGLGAAAIAAGAFIIWLIGKAIEPMAYSLSLARGLNAADLDVLELAIRKFLSLALKLSWYALLLPMISAGALVMRIVGSAVLPMATALKHAKGIDIASVEALYVATYVMVQAAILAGNNILGVLLGSLALYLLGGSIGSFVDALSKAKNFDANSIDILVKSIFILASAVSEIGSYLLGVLLGSLVLQLMSWGLNPLVDVFAKLQGIAVDISTIEALGYMIHRLAGIISEAGWYLIGVLLGSFVLQLMSSGLDPLVDVFAKLQGVTVDISTIEALGYMIHRLAGIISGVGLYIIGVLLGSYVLELMSSGLDPLVDVFAKLQGITVDLATIEAFGYMIYRLANIVSGLWWYALTIELGAYVADLLGNALSSFIPIIKTLSGGLDFESAYGFGVLVAILVKAAQFAGEHYQEVELGAFALALLGNAVSYFVPVIEALKGLEIESAYGFGLLVAILVDVAKFAGGFHEEILLGSAALQALGQGVEYFIPLVEAIKGLNPESAIGFSLMLATLIGSALLAWWFGDAIAEGSLALEALGESISTFYPLINSLSGLGMEDAETLKQLMISLIDGALYAADNFSEIMLGSAALAILGEAFKNVNMELDFFATTLDKLTGMADPLITLSETLFELATAISTFGGVLGTMTDEEIEKMVKLTAGISSETQGTSSSEGGLMEEIRDILNETREIHLQQAGNNVVAVNQSNMSSVSNKQDGPIVKSVRSSDSYFTRLAFKHHI